MWLVGIGSYLLEPSVGIYPVQGVLAYTDFGIWRRLENATASSDRRDKQYRSVVR